MFGTSRHKLRLLALTVSAISGLTAQAALGQVPSTTSVSVPSRDLSGALRALARQTGAQIVFDPKLVRGRRSGATGGATSLEDALKKMLRGTGLSFRMTSAGTYAVFLQEAPPMPRPTNAVQPLRSKLSAAAEEPLTSEEIVVTAQRRTQSPKDVPISIVALSGLELEQRGIESLQDLSFATPGLQVSDSGTYNRTLSIRGVGNVFGSSSLVGVYYDETPVALTPDGQLDLRPYDLERVEVLRGPQGTLYGEGSVGGTIRFITNKPDLSNISGKGEVDVSATRSGDESFRVRGVFNLPLVTDKLAVRIAGQYEDAGGWIDQPALNLRDINGRKLWNIRASALWQPVQDLKVLASATIHRNNAGADSVGEDLNGNFRQKFDDPSVGFSDDDYDIFNLTLNYGFGAVNFTSSTSRIRSELIARNFGYQCCVAAPTLGGYWEVLIRNRRNVNEAFSQEFRLNSTGNSALQWTLGAYYRDLDSNQSIAPSPFGMPGGTLDTDLFLFSSMSQSRSKAVAFFGEASYEITDRLQLGAGLRYFRDERRFRTAPSGPYQEGKFKSTNPRFYAKYNLTDDINVYASAAKGFRSGGFNAAGEPPFFPESVWSYEVGTKASLFDRRLYAEIALFQSKYSQYQIVGVIPNLGLNITSNAGTAHIRGVEWSFTWKPHRNVEVGLVGHYLDTEFKTINATTTSHLPGDPIDLVGKYSYGIWGIYKVKLGASAGGFVRFDYSEQGRSNFRNRSFGDNYFSQSSIVGLLNARVGMDWANYSVEIYADNLLNDRGFVSPLVIEESAARARPRTLGIKFEAAF